jgi:hypothetical protein
LLNVTDIGAQTYIDASPTVGELLSKTAGAFADVAAFFKPDAVIMHPRRWAWAMAAIDSSGNQIRPEWLAEVVMTAGVPTDLRGGTEDAVS